MVTIVKAPSRIKQIAARCADDFGRFCYDGFGVMLSDDQLEAHARKNSSTG